MERGESLANEIYEEIKYIYTPLKSQWVEDPDWPFAATLVKETRFVGIDEEIGIIYF